MDFHQLLAHEFNIRGSFVYACTPDFCS